MYLVDYHTHSLCSPDSDAPLSEMAEAAIRAGLSELCLTDHCDLLTLGGHPNLNAFSWEPIEQQMALVRPEVAGKLTLRMGLELGESWEFPEAAAKIVGNPDLDFVIGSAHNHSREKGGRDFYCVSYLSDDACYASLDDYFNSLEKIAALDCYDVLGHIIYPLRYMNTRDHNHVTLDRYYPQMKSIFRTVAAKGKGIELNTYHGSTIRDWRSVLEIYRDCGGKIVTLGSDAHQPSDVGKGIPEAIELLCETGFSNLAVYEKRKPKLIPLGSREREREEA